MASATRPAFYQYANAALYKYEIANGTDPDLKAFALETLPKIALEAILKEKSATPPPTLLKAAYATMVTTLQHEQGKTFDADYVRGQVKTIWSAR